MMERREFMKKTALTGLALSSPAALSLAQETNTPEKEKKTLARRDYGSSDQLSLIGFGGIVVMNAEPAHAARVVARAVDRGVNYFDVAPSYGDAQDKLGPALQPYRDRVFLACKTGRREKAGAEEELNDSLKKLRTDHFDLYQLHGLTTMDDLEKAAGPDGALETFVKAREAGKIRHVGFSAHSAEVALAAMDRFDFDSILFPFNFVCWHEAQFGPQVLAKAKEKNVARLALKAMAYSPWPENASHEPYGKCWYQPTSQSQLASKALRFTLSLDITAAIPPGEEALFDMALDIAENFQPLSPEELDDVKKLAQGVKPIFRLSA